MARQRCTDRARGEAHRSGLRARKHWVHGRLAQAIASTHLVRPRLAVLTLARPAASLLACAARSYAWRLTPCQPRTTGEHCTHATHVSPVPRTTAARHRNGRCAGCRPRSRGVAGVAARSHASRMWRRGGSDPQLRSPKMSLSRSMSGIAPGERRHCAHNWPLLSTRPPHAGSAPRSYACMRGKPAIAAAERARKSSTCVRLEQRLCQAAAQWRHPDGRCSSTTAQTTPMSRLRTSKRVHSASTIRAQTMHLVQGPNRTIDLVPWCRTLNGAIRTGGEKSARVPV